MATPKTQQCSKCNEIKPVSEFAQRPNRKKGYHSRCNPCLAEVARQRRKNHGEQINRLRKERREANPDKSREIAHTWRRANSDKVAESNAKWRAKNYEYVRNSNIRNYVRRAGGFVDPTLDIFDVFEDDNYICQLCFEPCDPFARDHHPDMATPDHIIPVSLGGSHTRDNVQTAHLRCNVSKNNRT